MQVTAAEQVVILIVPTKGGEQHPNYEAQFRTVWQECTMKISNTSIQTHVQLGMFTSQEKQIFTPSTDSADNKTYNKAMVD